MCWGKAVNPLGRARGTGHRGVEKNRGGLPGAGGGLWEPVHHPDWTSLVGAERSFPARSPRGPG